MAVVLPLSVVSFDGSVGNNFVGVDNVGGAVR